MDADELAAVESSAEDEVLEAAVWAEYEAQREQEAWEDEQREREAMMDPTMDAYYSDAAVQMRRDAGMA